MSKAARSVKQTSPDDRKVDDVSELLSKKQQPHGGQIKETTVIPQQQQQQQQQVTTKPTKQAATMTKPTITKPTPTKHHHTNDQRKLIRQYPLQLPIHYRSLTSPPIHRSLTSLLDRHHLTPLSEEHFELLSLINGRSLTRDGTTGRFVWHTASLLQPSSHFASSTWQQPCDATATPAPTTISKRLTDGECHTLHRKRWKEIMNTLLNHCPSLRKVVLSRSERLYNDMRCQWFKTMRIVCDSYTFFTCTDVKCPLSPCCPADLIRPSYCRGLQTRGKGELNNPHHRWNW